MKTKKNNMLKGKRSIHKIDPKLFKMCLGFGKALNYKVILAIRDEKSRERNVIAYRAYDNLLNALNKGDDGNRFRSEESVNYLNTKLKDFFNQFLELLQV